MEKVGGRMGALEGLPPPAPRLLVCAIGSGWLLGMAGTMDWEEDGLWRLRWEVSVDGEEGGVYRWWLLGWEEGRGGAKLVRGAVL